MFLGFILRIGANRRPRFPPVRESRQLSYLWFCGGNRTTSALHRHAGEHQHVHVGTAFDLTLLNFQALTLHWLGERSTPT
jgi:hypothetical protein